MSIAIWCVLAACAIAVLTDLRARKIPNGLTAALAVSGIALHAMQGFTPLAIAVATLLVVLIIGFVSFSFGWLGGGDVKLLAAGASVLSFPDAVPFLLYTAIGGGIFALVVALVKGRLSAVLHSVTLIVRPIAVRGTVSVAPATPIKLPYAVAIAFGAIAVALSHTAAPFLRLPL